VVGQDAETRWNEFHGKKEARDRVRGELGTPALTQKEDGTYAAATPELIATRKKAYESLNL
jgi:hypothetical protein